VKNDFEHRSIAFHNRARQILFSVYNDFRSSVAGIDRQRDENIFQQQRNKFASRLKDQLQSVVRETLDGTTVDANGTNRALSGFVEQYMHEFMQKVRAL
jgi:hypothetical protein